MDPVLLKHEGKNPAKLTDGPSSSSRGVRWQVCQHIRVPQLVVGDAVQLHTLMELQENDVSKPQHSVWLLAVRDALHKRTRGRAQHSVQLLAVYDGFSA
jgi:hypothetical protein